MKRITLTPTLSRRIVRDVREGVPPQVAAVKAGVPLEKFLDWLSRQGRRYVAFQQAIEQARAVAQAEHVLLLKKAARKGKFHAALTWLQAQAPEHFAPPLRGTKAPPLDKNTLLAQLKALPSREQVEAMDPAVRARLREAARKDNSLIGMAMQMKLLEGPPDSRLALPPVQEQPALPEPQVEEPRADAYEPNVISDREPNIVEMIRTLPPLPRAT
jgi:hypothetical protein